MAFTKYASADASAPILTGLDGSLQALIYACLVTGYGAKAAAGWSRPYLAASGNSAVFKPNDPQDCFFFLHDNRPGSIGSEEATLWMGSTHDGAGVLNNTAPQNIGYTTGWNIRKASSETATARPWTLYADGKTAILFIDSLDTAGSLRPYVFGKAVALSPLEAFPWLCSGRSIHNSSNITYTYFPLTVAAQEPSTYNSAATPFFADGAATGTALRTAFLEALRASSTATAPSYFGTGAPAPRTGMLALWDGLMVHDREPRFKLRGLSVAYSDGAIAHGDTFSATIGGVLRTFEQVVMTAGGAFLIETSDTLDL